MNNNQTIQQAKSDPKGKAIASLVLGIIGVISGIGAIYIYGSYEWATDLFLIVYLLIPLFGLILGIKGLKSTKKNLAIIGVLLCIIGLLGTILVCFLMRIIAEGM